MSNFYPIGGNVRMNRPPFFQGTIVAIQLPIFSEGGGKYYCRWRFMPEEWDPKTTIPESDLDLIEHDDANL